MFAIFGANGFIGQEVVARLVADGHPVRAVSRRFDPEFEAAFAPRVDFVEADLRDPFACLSALAGVSCVLQLVSSSSPGLSNAYIEQDILENVIPQVRFAGDCVHAGVERLVFISSGGAVYGPPERLPIPEDHPLEPLNSHGLTKLMTEKYLRMLARTAGLDAVILRVSNPFGPRQHFRKGQGLIPAVLERARRGLPVRIYGDGSAQRDYVYIGDVVEAIRLALTMADAAGGVFNIGSGEGRRVLDVLAAIEARLGRRLEREHAPARASDVAVNVLDIARAEAVLGWRPATPFETAMDLTLAGGTGG